MYPYLCKNDVNSENLNNHNLSEIRNYFLTRLNDFSILCVNYKVFLI